MLKIILKLLKLLIFGNTSKLSKNSKNSSSASYKKKEFYKYDKNSTHNKLYPTVAIKELKGAVEVFNDEKNVEKTFYSNDYNISARPDFIFKHKSGYAVVEFKSRRTGIYSSDEQQVIASVLAVRSEYYVNVAFILNSSGNIEK